MSEYVCIFPPENRTDEEFDLEEIRKRGWYAMEEGRRLSDCPFNGKEKKAWELGWRQARDSMK